MYFHVDMHSNNIDAKLRINGPGVAVVLKSEDTSISVGDYLTGYLREQRTRT